MKKGKDAQTIAEYFARTEQPRAVNADPCQGVRCRCGSTRVYWASWGVKTWDQWARNGKGMMRRETVHGYGCLDCWRRWR